MKNTLESKIGETVVLDTTSAWIYIGTLEAVTENAITLSQADVHDSTDSATTKERYISETRKTGVKPNRNTVYIHLSHVVSFSVLSDIKPF